MEYIDTLENLYGEIADVYQLDNGTAQIIFDNGETIPAWDTESAINKLYKNGFRF